MSKLGTLKMAALRKQWNRSPEYSRYRIPGLVCLSPYEKYLDYGTPLA